jgi:hypothetical protein
MSPIARRTSGRDPIDAADQIRRVIKRELAAVESALADCDIDIALAELDGAVRKLKRIASDLD